MKKLYKKTRKVCGVGTNDANYHVHAMVNGKKKACPFYLTWTNMLKRCYDTKNQYATYVGCSVDESWHSFMTFKAWMEKQDYQGNALDKDIILPDNKVYSASTCAFVPTSINMLLLDHRKGRGDWPRGVSFTKQNRFETYCKVNGVKVHLGLFDTAEQASDVYKNFKSTLVYKVASTYPDPRVAAGLKLHAAKILRGE